MADDPQTQKRPPTAKRKPRGFARIWNPSDIAQMTRITAQDVENAERWWRKHAVPRYRKLLDARRASNRDGGNDEA